MSPAHFAERCRVLDGLLEQNGRKPADVRRSMMTGCIFGEDSSAFAAKLAQHNITPEQVRENGLAAGTGNQIVDQLGEWGEAGVQRIILEWRDLDDLDGLEAMAHAVLPQVTG